MCISKEFWKGLPLKQQAIKMARTCKKIRDKTLDKELYEVMRTVITAVQDGRYEDAIEAVSAGEAVLMKDPKYYNKKRYEDELSNKV